MMRITYRRTGGLLTLLLLGVAGLAAALLTVAVAAAVLLVGAAGAAAALLVRAVLPRSWRRRTVPPVADEGQDVIEGTVVTAADDEG